MTGSTTAAGTQIALTAALPETEDAAGYADLTFTIIRNVESLPAFGPTSRSTEFQPLDGVKQTHKGAVDFGTMQVPMAYDEDDAGQILLRTAAEPGNNALYAFMVTYPTGAKRYFQGRVMGYPEEPGSATTVIKSTVTIAINTKVVKVDAA